MSRLASRIGTSLRRGRGTAGLWSFTSRLKSTQPAVPLTHPAASAVGRRLDTADASSMLDIGSREIFTEDHDIFRRSVRRFYQEECVPHFRRWEEQSMVDKEQFWMNLGKHGYLGISLAAEKGGPGGDFFYDSIVLEEQMYAGILHSGVIVHNQVCTPYISDYASQAQVERHVPGILSGETVMAIAMSEPGAGSDLQGIQTSATRDGDDWILNGSKIFITNGILADLFVVVAITDREAKSIAHGTTLFLVESGMKGFAKGRNLEKMGEKACDTAELFFDDVRLPNEAVLGEPGRGFYYMMHTLPTERLGIATIGVSHAEYMFELTRTYVKQRKAFGKSLAALQTIQHKLAEMKTEICICRSFVDRCLLLKNENLLTPQMASMAKYWATDMEKRVADQCVQLHGGWGYMMEMPIARSFTSSRSRSIYAGTNEIMKELIAREIVRK